MLIGDRYEIIEKIGTGGMSDVYKAKDQKLNRLVAVKVLKQEFSENRNFVSKFRVEAQAAAGLMHPNIVNVYDVGEEDGIHYIVMELVEGITLKKYIEKKVKLTTKEAISIAIQVAMGIEAAHNNHIIHRDIKPQNIIISKEGKVKVTDFGIAKAASSNTITSNVMGSVHYTSPEQARGGFSDEKSDIYSMGITMFEMLTGRVPFNGDTTVTIAIKHIQDPMPSIREFVPEVPVSVENIVMKCTQKSPDRRYQNMGEVIKDLKYSLVNPDAMIAVVDENDEVGKTKVSERPVQQPVEEVYEPYGEDVQNEQLEQPHVLDTVWEDRVPHGEAYLEEEKVKPAPKRKKQPAKKQQPKKRKKQQAGKQQAGKQQASKQSRQLQQQQPRRQQTANNVRQNDYDYEYEFDDFSNSDYDYNPNAEGLTTFLTIIAAVIIGCILLYFVAKATGIFEQITSSVSTGTSMSTTESETGAAVESEHAGNSIGSVAVPAVEGYSEAEGTAALTTAGFNVTKTQEYSTEFEKGTIISQTPAGNSMAALESDVAIVISMGSDGVEVKVPDVLGNTKEAAVSTLEAAGITVGTIEQSYSDEYAEGQVCYQSYASGTSISEDTKVDLKISLGKETVLYSCNLSVAAPSDYSGGNAEVILTTSDGATQLWYSQNVTMFPVSINLSGFESPSAYGIVTITYFKNVETLVPDAEGNMTTEVTQSVAQTQQTVQFTQN
jgi:serine/threonine-protein kinase